MSFLVGTHGALQLLRTFTMTEYASATDALSHADIICSSHVCMHTHTRTHARTHTHTHTHTPVSYTHLTLPTRR